MAERAVANGPYRQFTGRHTAVRLHRTGRSYLLQQLWPANVTDADQAAFGYGCMIFSRISFTFDVEGRQQESIDYRPEVFDLSGGPSGCCIAARFRRRNLVR